MKRVNMFLHTSLVMIAFSLFLSSCTPEQLPGGGGGTGGGGGISTLPERIIMDTAYGTHSRNKMDIYLPAGRTNATKLIVMIHGGGWETGNKSELDYYKNLLRAKWPEVAIANINYRLASNTANIRYNDIMNDVSSAVNFLVSNKSNFVTSDTLLMLGASAGGHLAMQYTYTRNTNGYVRAVADFYGPAVISDWEWYNSFNLWAGRFVKDIVIQLTGSAWDLPLYNSVSPYHTATASSKPTIIFHGNIDVVVPVLQSQWLRGKLNTLGVPNEYNEYFLDGHGFNTTNTDDAMNKTVSFFKRHLK